MKNLNLGRSSLSLGRILFFVVVRVKFCKRFSLNYKIDIAMSREIMGGIEV